MMRHTYLPRYDRAGGMVTEGHALSAEPGIAHLLRRTLKAPTEPAPDGAYDFVSRYFAPAKGIPEDPVTGGAHCGLTPYWAERLGKREFRAFQASRRGGEIVCRLAGDRVELEGACVFYLEGKVEM